MKASTCFKSSLDIKSSQRAFGSQLRGALQEKFNWQEGGLQEERPLISYGPCQFPTLGLIVQRQWCALSPVLCRAPVHLPGWHQRAVLHDRELIWLHKQTTHSVLRVATQKLRRAAGR